MGVLEFLYMHISLSSSLLSLVSLVGLAWQLWIMLWSDSYSSWSSRKCAPSFIYLFDYIWRLVVVVSIFMAHDAELMAQEPWKEWLFDGRKSILVLYTNHVYHKLIERTWHIARCIQWWHQVQDIGRILFWSSIPFEAFLWWAIVGDLPLLMALKHRYIFYGACVLHIMIKEDARHRFLACPISKHFGLLHPSFRHCVDLGCFLTFLVGFHSMSQSLRSPSI